MKILAAIATLALILLLVLNQHRLYHGSMADEKKEWDIFEKRVAAEAKMQKISVIRVPEEIRVPRMGQVIRIASPVDFCMGIDGRAAFMDAKVTNDRLWNLKKYVFADKKIHQFADLLGYSVDGNISGYLVWFVPLRKVSWIPIRTIQDAQKKQIASLHPESEGVVSQDDLTMIDFRKLLGIA